MTTNGQSPQATVVVEISGKVTIGYDAQMREAIVEATDAGARNILLNMERVSKIDSSGIGELAAAHISMQKRGGRLLLVGLSERLAAPLQIVNLLGVLEIYANVEEALAALDPPSE